MAGERGHYSFVVHPASNHWAFAQCLAYAIWFVVKRCDCIALELRKSGDCARPISFGIRECHLAERSTWSRAICATMRPAIRWGIMICLFLVSTAFFVGFSNLHVHAAGFLEKNFYLRGQGHTGELPACQAALPRITNEFAYTQEQFWALTPGSSATSACAKSPTALGRSAQYRTAIARGLRWCRIRAIRTVPVSTRSIIELARTPGLPASAGALNGASPATTGIGPTIRRASKPSLD